MPSPTPSEASLTVGTTPEGMLEVHSVLPDGIAIGTGPFGRSVVATKNFTKGATVYRGYCARVPTSDTTTTTEYLLHIYHNGESGEKKLLESVVLSEINSVKEQEGRSRQVYGL